MFRAEVYIRNLDIVSGVGLRGISSALFSFMLFDVNSDLYSE